MDESEFTWLATNFQFLDPYGDNRFSEHPRMKMAAATAIRAARGDCLLQPGESCFLATIYCVGRNCSSCEEVFAEPPATEMEPVGRVAVRDEFVAIGANTRSAIVAGAAGLDERRWQSG